MLVKGDALHSTQTKSFKKAPTKSTVSYIEGLSLGRGDNWRKKYKITMFSKGLSNICGTDSVLLKIVLLCCTEQPVRFPF